jgi:glycosyltransferase involved in cell wall biosynthesis
MTIVANAKPAPEIAARPVERRSVLFLVPDLEVAGPELRLLDFAKLFPSSIDVHVCALTDGGALLEDMRGAGARVQLVPIERAYAEWGQVRKIVDHVGRERIPIVNSLDFKTLLVAAAVKLRYGRRVTTVHHFVSLLDNWERRHKIMLKRLLRYVDVVVCNSNVVAEETLASTVDPGRIRVIKNGVDVQHYSRSIGPRATDRGAMGFDHKHFVVGTIANIRPVKNYPFLIQGFRRVHELFPASRLLCVGDGESRGEIEAMVRESGLAGTVHFCGSVRDVRPYLGTMDAFVLCSLKEGFPNVVLQAMAMEVPTISSAVGETTRIVDPDESGMLFDGGDLDGFVAAVTRLAGDPRLRARLARNGRRLVEEKYSMQRMIRDYVDLYAGLGSRR